MHQSIAGILDARGVWIHISGLSRGARAAGLTTHEILTSQRRIWEYNDPENGAILLKNFDLAKKTGSAHCQVESNVGVREHWDVWFIRLSRSRVLVHAIELFPNHPRLSARDRLILSKLADDLKLHQVAKRLKMDSNAFHQAAARLRKKFGVRTTHGLIAAAARHGLID